MIKSQGWDWKIVKDDNNCIWKNPSMESFYLVNRWKRQNKKDFLDLGCGLGRHAILFGKNDFNVSCFDISEEAINKTKDWAKLEKLKFDYQIGDMLSLPYKDNSFDAIISINVISHTDTSGIKKVINEIYRVLRDNGECYLTICSKDTWGFKENWPKIDDNTNLMMIEGPEYKVPHFYGDYNLIKLLFSNFEILDIHQKVNYYEHKDNVNTSYHYHLLIRKR